MDVRFLLTYQDFADAQRTHRRRWFKAVVIGLIIVTGLGILWAVTREVQRAYLYALPLWSLLLLLSLTFNRAWKGNFNKAFPTPRNIHYSFEEDAVRVDTEVAQATLQWPSFQFFREGKNIFLIYPQPRMFNMIPKRVLSTEQQQELRELLKRKL